MPLNRRLAAIFLAVAWSYPALAVAFPARMVTVGPGVYRPFYPVSSKEVAVPVPAFRLDVFPVTNSQFLSFVTAHSEWQRGRVSRLFADSGYLSHWESPNVLGPSVGPEQPVTNVSWFAAKAYCRARSARLPREAEWEFAAAEFGTGPDGKENKSLRNQILDWYARPSISALQRVGRKAPNRWRVHDLHGLIWEWVLDFNSTLVSSDARESGDKDLTRFCGAGALGASDTTDYVSFMRTAFRSSLHADFTTKNLGFRCAADLTPRSQ